MKKNKLLKISVVLIIILIIINMISQKFYIKPPFLLTRLDEHEKVNIKSVKLNELQNVTNSIEPYLEFAYMRCDNRQELSSSNDTFVNLTIDIDKQILYEKVLANNKVEPIKIPPVLAGYKMIYVKGYSNQHIWIYFVKDNKVKIMLLDAISNRGRFKEIASIVAFGNIYKAFTKNIDMDRTNDKLVYIKKNKANKIVFYSKRTIQTDIIFYTNKSKNSGIIIERGE